jgi:hypothetical protein
MELRSGRILSRLVRTVFKNDDERKEYLCDTIKDLLDQSDKAHGMEKKIYYVGQVYKIILAHKDFIWTHPAFKKFKKAATNKAKELKKDMAKQIAEGLLLPDIYKEAIAYLMLFLKKHV